MALSSASGYSGAQSIGSYHAAVWSSNTSSYQLSTSALQCCGNERTLFCLLQALAQTDTYLRRLNVVKEAVDDTAGAAQMVARQQLKVRDWWRTCACWSRRHQRVLSCTWSASTSCTCFSSMLWSPCYHDDSPQASYL